jgi:tetratricopeptide (TPR) repeat protein
MGYGVRDVARMLGLTPSQIRAFVREGIVAPRRGPRRALRFSFADLVLLRSAGDLVAARVPTARVRRALRRLRTQLPAGRALSAVRVTAEGEHVVVRDGAARWHPESGQALLDFEVRDLASRVSPLLSEATRSGDPDALYTWGCDLEEAAPEQAQEAYRRALALDPDHPGANLALGRLLHEARWLEAAERHTRRALEARPGDTDALFNLGVVLEDQGRLEEALAAYEASAAAAPRRDSHHNAARLCEKLGRPHQALRHLGAARRLPRSSP